MRSLCPVADSVSPMIDVDLIVRGLVEILTIVGENADPFLLAQSEALLNASNHSERVPLNGKTNMLVSVAEALACEGSEARMEFRLNGLQKLFQMSSLADHCVEAMHAGKLESVVTAMECARNQQKSYTRLAEEIWSLLRRFGGR